MPDILRDLESILKRRQRKKGKKAPPLESPTDLAALFVEKNKIRKRPAGVHRDAILGHRGLALTLFGRRFNEGSSSGKFCIQEDFA